MPPGCNPMHRGCTPTQTQVRVLFVSSSKAELQRCFELLDDDGSGALQLNEVKQLLFVCGESLQVES